MIENSRRSLRVHIVFDYLRGIHVCGNVFAAETWTQVASEVHHLKHDYYYLEYICLISSIINGSNADIYE